MQRTAGRQPRGAADRQGDEMNARTRNPGLLLAVSLIVTAALVGSGCGEDDDPQTVECDDGFERGPSGQCLDIDECAQATPVCGPNARCINTQGSYRCTCLPGYAIGASFDCEDIDECAEDEERCGEASCVNTPGSYTCACDEGFELDPEALTCDDVDECADEDICGEEATCENVEGGYECVCIGEGQEFDPEELTCFTPIIPVRVVP